MLIALIDLRNFKMIDLSIIVPVYNVSSYIRRCVDSILNQDLELNRYEIILVDDGSTDDSGKICDEYSNLRKNIFVIHKNNGGLADARNAGLSFAHGRYIMFVDSDDYIKSNVLSLIVEEAIINNVDIYSYEMECIDASGSIKYMNYPFEIGKIYSSHEVLFTITISTVCASLYSMAFITRNKLKFTKGITHEDVDFNNKSYALVDRIMFSSIPVYVYCWNSESLNRSNDYNKVKKKILDDIVVAKNAIDFADSHNLPSSIKYFFSKRANSIVTSQLYHFLLHKENIPKDIETAYIQSAKTMGLFPIKGKCESFKSTVMSYLINIIYRY